MKLSDTESGKKWLATIKPSDEDVAKRLLNNLILVSRQKFYDGIERLLSSLPRDKHKIPLSAIYVPIEAPIKPGPHPKGSKYPAHKYPFFDSNGKAVQLNPQNVGSEGGLLNFLRNKYNANKHYVIWPNLDVLRDKEKCVRRIIFIDDCVGSGERVVKFFRWFFENKSLKSLYSRKKIKFYVLSYAMTIQGEEYIKKIKRFEDCLSCVELTKGRFFWSEEQYKEYENFCKRNFKKDPTAFHIDNGIGYENSFSMIAFEHGLPKHGLPNNAPNILRKLELKESDFNRHFIEGIPNLDKEAYLILKKNIKSECFQRESALIYRFLFFLLKCPRRNGIVRKKMANDYLEIYKDVFSELVNKCLSMNLVDENYKLTQKARSLFKRWKIDKIEDVENQVNFYYY